MEPKLKMLLSDDNQEFCTQFCAAMQSYGFDCALAPCNGQLLIDKIKEYRPNVVMMNAHVHDHGQLGKSAGGAGIDLLRSHLLLPAAL